MRAAMMLPAVLALACAVSQPWSIAPEPARDLPLAFVPDSTFEAPDPGPETCLVHLTDPRDRTRLLLVRSIGAVGGQPARGDYAVEPEGRYGVEGPRLLRVACGSWRGLGIVPR